MRSLAQGRSAVQHMAGIFNDFGAAFGVVAAFFADFFAAFGLRQDIGTIQRIVQRAPTGIGGVQCIAGIQHRHHELGASLHGQFSIHLGGGDAHLFRVGHQVPNFLQEGAVGGHVGHRARVGRVPGIQFGLQAVTLGQQGDVLGCQISHQAIKAFPELGRRHASAGQDLGVNELK